MSGIATLVAADDGRPRDRPPPREQSFVDGLVDRLHAEFGGEREQIRHRATEVLATFANARVQTFVPILVEKALRRTLRPSPQALAPW